MDITDTVKALSALAQESRLNAFRLLVRSGPDGLAAGDARAEFLAHEFKGCWRDLCRVSSVGGIASSVLSMRELNGDDRKEEKLKIGFFDLIVAI